MSIFYIDSKNINSEFKRLADSLLLEKQLVVNDSIFRFTEIEFYYYCNSHPDGFTHPHKEEPGKWRFHNQGFDITLKGNDSGHGGILIRGIKLRHEAMTSKKDYTNGPRRVIFEIMRSFKPVNVLENRFGLEKGDKIETTVFQTYREGLVNPAQDCKNPEVYKEAPYRFMIEPRNFKKSQFKGAEKIARTLKDANLREEFLGYKLKV